MGGEALVWNSGPGPCCFFDARDCQKPGARNTNRRGFSRRCPRWGAKPPLPAAREPNGGERGSTVAAWGRDNTTRDERGAGWAESQGAKVRSLRSTFALWLRGAGRLPGGLNER
jgi:hypothetical protein